MEVPKIEINIYSDKFMVGSLFTDLNIIPYPCAIYIEKSKKIYLNIYTAELLGLKQNERFDIEKFLVLNPSLQSILHKDEFSNINAFRKVKLKLFNDKYENISIRVQSVDNKKGDKTYFIFISKTDSGSDVNSMFSLYLMKNEIAQLKPFLNTIGISKLNKINETFFGNKNKILILEDMVSYEDELQAIQKEFSTLSSREVLICVLLYNNLSINDIAKLLNRTLNSVSVTIHRINRKLNLANRNELIQKIREVIVED